MDCDPSAIRGIRQGHSALGRLAPGCEPDGGDPRPRIRRQEAHAVRGDHAFPGGQTRRIRRAIRRRAPGSSALDVLRQPQVHELPRDAAVPEIFLAHCAGSRRHEISRRPRGQCVRHRRKAAIESRLHRGLAADDRGHVAVRLPVLSDGRKRLRHRQELPGDGALAREDSNSSRAGSRRTKCCQESASRRAGN